MTQKKTQGAKRPQKRTTSRSKTTRKTNTNTKSKARTTRRTTPKKTQNPFKNATSVEVTANKIAITKKTSTNSKGSYSSQEKRVYVDKTPTNIQKLNREMGARKIKKTRVEFK